MSLMKPDVPSFNGIPTTFPSLVKMMTRNIFCLILVSVGVAAASAKADTSVDDLPDLTGGVVPVVQYKGRDPFSGRELTSVSQVEYEIRVKNQTGDPLRGDSVIVVVEDVREISGKDITAQVEIEGFDGTLQNGKPFFRVPITGNELPPYGESDPLTIRINNPNYLRFYPPNLRIRGIRRSANAAMKDLLESLIQKGVLHPEEASKVLENAGEGTR